MVGSRLVVWAPCQKPSTSHLPTLDPDSLYAASILQARRVPDYSINAPSSLLHSRVPCLEESSTGVTLAEDIDSIERYSRKHARQEISILDDDQNEETIDDRTRKRRWAQRKAMERYILSTLHPLIYQVLFSQDLYSSHTAKVYQSGLSVLNRGSLISRLRREMRQQYAMKAKAMENSRDIELCAILAESNAAQYIRDEEERDRQDLADRGGIARDGKRRSRLVGVRGDGLLQEEKAAAARAFSEMRLRTYASKLFDTLAEALGSDEYFYASKRPSLLDLRLFSLLGPMLLPMSTYSKLAKTSVASLLRSNYPTLVHHSERVQKLIWPIKVQPLLEASADDVIEKHFVSTPGWPEIAGRQDETIDEASEAVTIRLASGLGRVCGQTYCYVSSMLSSIDRPKQDVKKEEKTDIKKPVMTQAEKMEARRVTIGKWIWISSAVVGLIGTAFASGLLSVELVDGEAEEEEDDDESGEKEVTEFFKAKLHGDAKDGDAKDEEELLEDNATEVGDEEEFEIVIVDEEDLDEGEEEIELEED